MIDFMVWDKSKNEFFNLLDAKSYEIGDIILDDKNYTLFQYTGKVDDTPQKNKIYANYSIVEFEHDTGVDEWETVRGYFTYGTRVLQYYVAIGNVAHLYFNGRMRNFKVVGSLQQIGEQK